MADFIPTARFRLPKGRQYALTWGIPDDFGGMTSAMLHRSRALTVLGGRPVGILTFDARPDYPRLGAQLRAAGELVGGMRLLNLYDWFREHDVPPGRAGAGALSGTPLPELHAFSPLGDDPAHRSALRDGTELSRTRRARDGSVLQVDHFRADGSLLISERRDMAVHGEGSGEGNGGGSGGGRGAGKGAAAAGEPGGPVFLCDRSGAVVRSWRSTWSFYRFWLDLVTAREPSFMIVDSKPVARFMLTYRRRGAVTMHVVHNSHLSGNRRPFGPLRPSRRSVFENLSDFDAVVLLTSRQKQDVEALLGPAGNLCTIPNSRDLGRSRRLSYDRPPGRGVVLASLTHRKRVHHAVRAAVAAAERADGPVTLDVFGDGKEREPLRRLIADLGADGHVRLRGHLPQAREHLAEASFIVLTGRTEGLPLVLVEAMAAGCVPVAYDVPYGPADVIVHGRNGFLIAPGDVRALTDTIVRLGALPARQLKRMRRHARRTARRFSDSGVTRLWAREMRSAERRHLETFGNPGWYGSGALGTARRAWLRLVRRARGAGYGRRRDAPADA